MNSLTCSSKPRERKRRGFATRRYLRTCSHSPWWPPRPTFQRDRNRHPNAADASAAVSGEMPTTFFSGLGPEDPDPRLRDRYIADPHPSKLRRRRAYRTEGQAARPRARPGRGGAARGGRQQGVPAGRRLRAAHEAAARLVLGDAYSDRVLGADASGTGGHSLAARVVGAKTPGATVYVPAPTWPIHYDVFRAAGLEVASYRYYDASTCALDFGGLCADLEALPLGAAVVLHACAHNPTGADPTPEQWRAVGAIVRRRLLPIFTSRTRDGQPTATSTTTRAARAIPARTSSARTPPTPSLPHPPAGTRCATSPPSATSRCSSSSRSPRTGCTASASAPCSPSRRRADRRRARLARPVPIRAIYSSLGARRAPVAAVLGDAARAAKWRAELATMAGRMHEMREALHAPSSPRSARRPTASRTPRGLTSSPRRACSRARAHRRPG